MANAFQIKQDICEVGRRIWLRGFVAANDGNISGKVDDNEIICTPTGVSKGFLTPEMLATVDGTGRQVRGDLKVSSETAMHIMAYRARPDIGAVVHAHPPIATGFAVAGLALDQCVLPEVVVTLGGVPLSPYGLPSSQELPDAIEPYIKQSNVVLMANHGIVAVGDNIMQAYYRMETVEHFAKILMTAVQLGNVNLFSPDRVTELENLRKRFGINGPSISCTLPTQIAGTRTGTAPDARDANSNR